MTGVTGKAKIGVWRPVVAVAAGAALLAWPALLNGYPILFSDTATFLDQTVVPDAGWDKPLVYGPFLTLFHWQRSLWPPVAAQALIVSHLLWLAARVFGRTGVGRHVLLCAGVAGLTAAPWFVSFLMPDIFAAVTVLAVALLGLRAGSLTRGERAWVTAVGVLAVAVHLTHLIVAAAAILAARSRVRAAAPLAGALAVLVATNLAAHGRLSVSPYGSVFALARLVDDGPARDYLTSVCPAAGYRTCAWVGRWPRDSDAFLWDSDGPVWSDPAGAKGFAKEASAIVTGTVLAEPVRVARAAAANTLRQVAMADLGDTLEPLYLYESVGQTLRWHFPPRETARFLASRQARGQLARVGARFVPVHRAVLAAGLAGCLWVVATDAARRRLALACLLGVLANAAATGALSGPHDRYQARIAWIVALPPALALLGTRTGTVRPMKFTERGRLPPRHSFRVWL